MKYYLSIIHRILFSITFLFSVNTVYADTVISCELAVSNANNLLKQQNIIGLNDEIALVKLLRDLNRDNVLPNSYVTTQYAKEKGWKGEGSLWDIWLLNKKVIGGDPYTESSIVQQGTWYSADLESVRGNRSNKRLVYSPNNQIRYLTTNAYKNFVEIAPCQ